MKNVISIVEIRRDRSVLERNPRFEVHFRGKKWGQLYFNMRGYTGCYLPAPGQNSTEPIAFDVGECSIEKYRKEISRLNRAWKRS